MNRQAPRLLSPAALCLGALFTAPLAAEPIVLRLEPDSSRVQYHIEHSISAVTDVAGTPRGELRLELDAGTVRLEGEVGVDLRRLQTGISKRDQHIKSAEYLDVERHPEAAFVLTGVAPDSSVRVARAPAPPWWAGRARGSLSLHGVSHDVEVPVGLWWLGEPGRSGLRVRGDFVLALADYGIKRPKKLVFSAGKSVDVHLDLVFAP